jgi:hypothetical protein
MYQFPLSLGPEYLFGAVYIFLRKFPAIFSDQGAPPMSLIPDTLIPVVRRDLRMSPRIFEKNRNGHQVIFRGFGEDDS